MLRVPLVVARTELRRTGRVVAGDRTKLLTFLAIGLFAVGPITAVGLLVLPELGEAVAAGSVDVPGVASIVEIATGATAVVWVFLAGMATMRTVTNVADVDQPACSLVSTSVRNVVVGLLAAEFAFFVVWIAPPLLFLTGAFAYGFGSVAPVVLAAVVVGTLLLSAIPAGFVVGVWIRHLLTVYEPIARHRTPILVGLAVVYFGAIVTGRIEAVTSGLFFALTDSPLGWPGHLLLLAVPTAPPSAEALLGAAVGTVLVAVVGTETGVRSAGVHWFADPARPDDSDERSASAETAEEPATATESGSTLGLSLEDLLSNTVASEGRLSSALDRRVRTVALTSIRRTKRAPARLLYAAYPLFGSLFFVQETLRTGTLPAYTAVLLCGYVVWGSGALFALNPLGEPGRALPAVLTSTVSGRDVVAGLVVASAIVCVPLGLVVSLVAGVASPLSLEATGALLVGTTLGAVVSPALATGVGCAFPRFGSVRVTSNREAVMPSKTAFVIYTLALAAPAAAATVLYVDAAAPIAAVLSALVSLAPWFSATVPAWTIAAVAWFVAPLGVVAPPVSAWYATRRLDEYTFE